MQIDKMFFETKEKLQDLFDDVKTLQEKFKFKMMDFMKDDCMSPLNKLEFTMYKKVDPISISIDMMEKSKWFKSLPSVREIDFERLKNLEEATVKDFFKAFSQPLQSICNIPKKIGGKTIKQHDYF